MLRLRTDSWAPSAKNFVSADTSSGGYIWVSLSRSRLLGTFCRRASGSDHHEEACQDVSASLVVLDKVSARFKLRLACQ